MAPLCTQLPKPEVLEIISNTFPAKIKLNVMAHLFYFLNISLIWHSPPISTTTILIQATTGFYYFYGSNLLPVCPRATLDLQAFHYTGAWGTFLNTNLHLPSD